VVAGVADKLLGVKDFLNLCALGVMRMGAFEAVWCWSRREVVLNKLWEREGGRRVGKSAKWRHYRGSQLWCRGC
jgi:hypothetical protein